MRLQGKVAVVAGAGSGMGRAIDSWRRVLSINLDGPMFTSRRAVPHMVALDQRCDYSSRWRLEGGLGD